MKPKYSLCIYLRQEDMPNYKIVSKKYGNGDIFRIGMELILETINKKRNTDEKLELKKD